MAARAASDMVAGRTIETDALVASLRNFIREVLDLDAVPADLVVPQQGPTRTASASQRGSAAPAGGRAAGSGNRGGGEMVAGGMLGGVGMRAAAPSPDGEALPKPEH
jgi:hypothetical protein